ncbi:hypothetical protein ACHAQH_004834 [Verticillium albo-atrum]
MSDKPTTSDDERAHGAAMAENMPDDRERDEVCAANDPTPVYEEDRSNDPPVYDPVEEHEAPGYTEQSDLDEWMRGSGPEDLVTEDRTGE